MTKRRVALILVALVVLGVVALTIPLPPGNVVTVADRFQPTGAFETRTTIEPRRLLCVGDNACPSVHRSFKFSEPVTATQLAAWLDDAGFTDPGAPKCDVGTPDAPESCHLRVQADGREVLIFVNLQNLDYWFVSFSVS